MIQIWEQQRGNIDISKYKQERQITIVNTEESYLGDYIKEWCEYHKKHETEYRLYAEEIIWEYFRNDIEFKPNLKKYYYVYRKSNKNGFMEVHLKRDLIKSPKNR